MAKKWFEYTAAEVERLGNAAKYHDSRVTKLWEMYVKLKSKVSQLEREQRKRAAESKKVITPVEVKKPEPKKAEPKKQEPYQFHQRFSDLSP